jgi:hypothetical protein
VKRSPPNGLWGKSIGTKEEYLPRPRDMKHERVLGKVRDFCDSQSINCTERSRRRWGRGFCRQAGRRGSILGFSLHFILYCFLPDMRSS